MRKFFLSSVLILGMFTSCDVNEEQAIEDKRSFISQDIVYLSKQLRSDILTSTDRAVYVECIVKLNALIEDPINSEKSSEKTQKPGNGSWTPQ